MFLTPVSAIGGICAQIVHGNFYDLGQLKSDSGYSLDISNYKGKVLFNMCQFLSFRCPGYNDSIAVYRSDELCIPLTMNSLTSGFNTSIIEKENQADREAGINFTFTGVIPTNAALVNESSKYNLQFLLSCDPNKTDGYVWDDPLPVFSPTNGTITIYGRGAISCPKVSGSFIVEFFDKFSFLTAVIAIIIGAIQCFYGYRLYRPTVFLLGFVLAFLVIVLFLFEIWTGPESPSYKGYVIVAFAVIIGIMFGFLVAAVASVAIVVSGAILGFFLSSFLYSLAFYTIASKPANLLLYNTLAVGLVVGSIAGYEFQDTILILSCSFTGAYLLVRGVSVFLGGFPSELTLSASNQEGTDSPTLVYYGYLAAVLILTAAGILVQRKLMLRDSSEDKRNRLLRSLLAPGDRDLSLVDREATDALQAHELQAIAPPRSPPKTNIVADAQADLHNDSHADQQDDDSEEDRPVVKKKKTVTPAKYVTPAKEEKKPEVKEVKKAPAEEKKAVKKVEKKVVSSDEEDEQKHEVEEVYKEEEIKYESEEEKPAPKVVSPPVKKKEEVAPVQISPTIINAVHKSDEEAHEIPESVEVPPPKPEQTNPDHRTTEDSENHEIKPLKKKIKKAIHKGHAPQAEDANISKNEHTGESHEESSEIKTKKVKVKKKVVKKAPAEQED